MGLADDTIHIIIDYRQSIYDYERLLGEFIQQSVIPKYRFWSCVIDKDSVVRSINLSHKMIVRWAKENNKPYIFIAEQDLEFSHSTSWEYFLKNKPQEYGLYLSSTYVKDLDRDIICGFHLYCVHQNVYDAFLSIPENEHIDTAANDLKCNVVICKPFVALQRAGYSSNNKSEVNYNSVLLPEDIYRG